MGYSTTRANEYRPPLHAAQRSEEQFQVFVASILTMDWERGIASLMDTRNGAILREVNILPANSNSAESSDVAMPEEGALFLTVPIFYDNGYVQYALLTPVVTDIQRSQDVIGYNMGTKVPIVNRRVRGNYRKAYPGQRAVSMASGYTEKVDAGWDKSSQDMTRDRLDTVVSGCR